MRPVSHLFSSVVLCLSLIACSDKGGDGSGDDGSTGSGSSDGADDDGDGYTAADDCDDSNPAINPGAVEICDGLDNNCDDLTDDADPSVESSTGSTWFLDGDGDGFGDEASTVDACEAPADHVADGGDCNDSDAAVNPSATEVCDDMDVDEDCSGAADSDDPGVDLSTAQTYFPDSDGDGFGDSASAGSALCEDPSTVTVTWVTNSSDCDDGDSAVNPDATEVCDDLDVDEDCSGTADNDDPGVDGATRTLFYVDGDGDGYGSELDSGGLYCDAFIGVVSDNTDCDDSDGAINPGATEVCDELDADEDCSGAADDADLGVDTATQSLFYADSDGDGYGSDADSGTLYCDEPSAMVADNTDCDDADGDVSPAATEICDGIDNDCDSGSSEAGMASFEDSLGTVTDYTTTLTGSSGAPAVASLTTAGSLSICEGTWYVNLDAAADVDIINPSGVPSDVVLDGAATASVIQVDTDGVSVYLEGLSIENGYGSGDSLSGAAGISGGAIDCTADGSTISAMSVDIQSNTAADTGDGAGGGISSYGCDLMLEDMVITDNTAAFGGGIYIDSAVLSMVDSVMSDNVATYYGGAFMTYDTEAATTLDFNEVDVRDNTAGYLGGGAFVLSATDYGVSLACTGSTGTTAGFTGNSVSSGSSASGGGLALYGNAFFEADSCDFGTSSGGDNNSPEDISGDLSYIFDYDDDETFLCTSGYCGNEAVYPIGADTYTNTGTNYVSGNIILADSMSVIRSFGMNLSSSSSSCTANYYVLVNSYFSTTGWSVVHANLGVSVPTTATDVDGGTMDVRTYPGFYYALLVGSTCSSGYTIKYDYVASGGTDAGFGSVEGYAYNSYSSSPFSEGDSVDLSTVSSLLSCDLEVTVLEY